MSYAVIDSGRNISLDKGHMPQFMVGLDLNKPSSPGVGDRYVATDTSISYECYVAGVWTVVTPFTKYTNVTGSRQFDMVYQNSSGKLMLVFVNIRHYVTMYGVSTYVEGWVGATIAANDILQAVTGIQPFSQPTDIAVTYTLCVPPGYYYKLASHTEANSGSVINHILEVT